MFRHIVVTLVFLTITSCEEARKQKYENSLSTLDKHITHTLAYHYLWPWSQLIRAVAALEAEDSLEEPQIMQDKNKYEVTMNVRRFKPDELRVRVKNRYIIVEGKHKEANQDNRFMANHFIQRFVLPPGSKQEEVSAVLKENNVLTVTVPRHEIPPPPPEREVPIEVQVPEVTAKPVETVKEKEETTPAKKEDTPVQTTSSTPLEQLDLVEATTHVGKIRKKELKTTTKTAKDNEVTKGIDGNGLDYALVESE